MTDPVFWGDRVKLTTVATGYHRYSVGLLAEQIKRTREHYAMESLLPPSRRPKVARCRDWLADKLLAMAYRISSPRWTAE